MNDPLRALVLEWRERVDKIREEISEAKELGLLDPANKMTIKLYVLENCADDLEKILDAAETK